MSSEETIHDRPRNADVTPTQLHAESATRVDSAAITNVDDAGPTRVDDAGLTRVDDAGPTRVDDHSPTAEFKTAELNATSDDLKTTELKVSDGESPNKLARLEMADKPGYGVKTSNARPSAMRLGEMSPEAVQEAVRKVGYAEEEVEERAPGPRWSRFWVVALVGGVLAFVVVSLAIRGKAPTETVKTPATAAVPIETAAVGTVPTQPVKREAPEEVVPAASVTAPVPVPVPEKVDTLPPPSGKQGVPTNAPRAPKPGAAPVVKPANPDDLFFPATQ